MVRFTFATAAVFVAVPAMAFAASPRTEDANPAKTCKVQLAAIGGTAFRAMYSPGGANASAFGKCVSKAARDEQENRTEAASHCRAEQEDANFAGSHAGKSFAEFYGTNKNGRNAFGKCVSAKSEASSAADQQKTLNAAKACKAERDLNRSAFEQKYGTNKNRRNAFGKCVSSKSKTQ